MYFFLVIFCLCCNEAGTHVYKDDFVRLIQACDNGYVPEAIAELFLDVSFKILNIILFRTVFLRFFLLLLSVLLFYISIETTN